MPTPTTASNVRHVDLLDVIDDTSHEDRAIQSTVRRFADERLRPHIAGWFDKGRLPSEIAHEFGDLGLLGMHLKGYDCAGTSATAYGLACLELEAVDSGLRSFVSVQGSLSMYSIYAFGTDE